MKKLFGALAVLSVLAVVCTDVPVKRVERCLPVVDVQLVKESFLGWIPSSDEYVLVKVVLADGKEIRRPYQEYQYDIDKFNLKTNLLEYAKRVEMGKEYCSGKFEKFEPVGK